MFQAQSYTSLSHFVRLFKAVSIMQAPAAATSPPSCCSCCCFPRCPARPVGRCCAAFSDLLRPSICAASHGRDAAAFCTTRRPGSRAAGPPTAAAVRQKSACLLFMLAGLCLAAAGAVCLRSGLLSSAHYCAVGTLSLPFQAVVQRSQAELPRPLLF